LKKILSSLAQSKSVIISGHAHDGKGHLYQGITAQEIAHAIHEKHQIFVTKDLIMNYDKPIKTRGDHEITLGTSHHSISYTVKIS
jgi:ribosomal protein L9